MIGEEGDTYIRGGGGHMIGEEGEVIGEEGDSDRGGGG